MRNLPQISVLIIVATLLSGCATGPKYEEVRYSFGSPASGNGRIFFYRQAVFMGDAIQPQVKLNGDVVGKAEPGGFFFVDGPPGDYEVLTSTEVDERLTFTLDEAEVRYVKMSIQMGILVGRVIPRLVDEVEGSADLEGLSYTGSRQVSPSGAVVSSSQLQGAPSEAHKMETATQSNVGAASVGISSKASSSQPQEVSPSGAAMAGKLAALKLLHEESVLTDEEYEQKQRQVIERQQEKVDEANVSAATVEVIEESQPEHLRVAILPFATRRFGYTYNTAEWDLSKFSTNFVSGQRGLELVYSYYLPEFDRGLVIEPDSVWQGGNVRKVPKESQVYTSAGQLNADVAPTYFFAPRTADVYARDLYKADVYVFDLKYERLYHDSGDERHYKEVTEQLFEKLIRDRDSSAGQDSPLPPKSSSIVVAGVSSKPTTTAPGHASSESLPKTVTVNAKAAGKFGAVGSSADEGSLDLVEAYVFAEPGKVTLKAKGTVDLHPSRSRAIGIGPGTEGKSWVRGTSGCSLPLEEKLVDARGFGALTPTTNRVGVLFGAFVAEPIVNRPGFRPINDDFPNGGISSGGLFLVGEGVTFVAEEPGTLFLGVNDCRPSNNSGSFSVVISAAQ